jgi:hypothetical protein
MRWRIVGNHDWLSLSLSLELGRSLYPGKPSKPGSRALRLFLVFVYCTYVEVLLLVYQPYCGDTIPIPCTRTLASSVRLALHYTRSKVGCWWFQLRAR